MERYRTEGGLELFDDRDCVELLLEMAQWVGNRQQMAEMLITEFGSFRGVIEARSEQLVHVRGLGLRTAESIRLVASLTRFWERAMMRKPDHIYGAWDAERYCKSLLMGLRSEAFYAICLTANCDIIGKRKISEGSLSEVNSYPRIVIETALNYNAYSVLFCHNHPGGTKKPSEEDISSTIILQKLLGSVGIVMLDHIIVRGNECYSMIREGDIEYQNSQRRSEL